MFPKHTGVIRDPKNPLFQEWQQKQIGFSPLVFCEFFQGMDVLQTQGNKSGEYIFGLYWAGKYCGFVYFGTRYTQEQAAKLAAEIMPPTWKKINEYVIEKGDKIWYFKYAKSQYAFVTEPVLTKIEKS